MEAMIANIRKHIVTVSMVDDGQDFMMHYILCGDTRCCRVWVSCYRIGLQLHGMDSMII